MNHPPVSAARQRMNTVASFLKVYAICCVVWGLFQAAFSLGFFSYLVSVNSWPREDEMPAVLAVFGSPSCGGLMTAFLAVFLFLGGSALKRAEGYGRAMFASILLILPCGTPCCLLGLPLGIWGLVTLSSQDVKNEFLTGKR